MNRARGTLRHLTRRVDRWLNGGCGILTYHRVATVKHDPWSLAVRPERFAEQLEVLRRVGAVMTIDRMTRALRAGTLPRRAIAITFDDGYADNLLTAKPLLERHEVPASIFLCTGLLVGRGSFWWDALLWVLTEPETLPSQMEISLDGQTYNLTLENLEEAKAPADRNWEPPPTSRHATYRELCDLLRPLTAQAQSEAVAEVAAWAGVNLPEMPDNRPLSRAEAATLIDGGLIEIGAHTLTHPDLPAIAAGLQRDEIIRSKADCEEIAGRPVTSFAYPHGRHAPETVKLVREAGFCAACTTAAGFVRKSTDPFLLPRIQVLDWDGAEFERRIETIIFP